ncbi:MAG: hypothetical protein H0X50_05180 [Nitrosopumilus sp.]|nr:hypothetical protein [Nitrosopumilus sp.]
MRKILITAVEQITTKLVEKLRHRYDVEVHIVPIGSVCEIKANIKNRWVTICRFASDESLRNIMTMFEINYNLKSRQ